MNDMTDDDALSAYIDGELSAGEAERLAERLAKEPALIKRLENMRSADAGARKLYAELDSRPMPKAVLDLLEPESPETGRAAAGGDNVVALPQRSGGRWFDLPMALAASVALVAGVFLGDLAGNGGGSRVDAPGLADVVSPDSDLHSLLENTVSAEAVAFTDGSQGTVVLTFGAANGGYCRQFHIEQQTRAVDGLACQEGGRWSVETLSFGPASTGDFQTASPASAAAVRAAVDARIGNTEPLSPEEEISLISVSWKKSAN